MRAPSFLRLRPSTRLALLAAGLGVAISGLPLSEEAISGLCVSAPVAFAAEETVVIVLLDGTEISGVLVSESDDEVAIRSTFGVTTIARVRIREIKRGENPFTREYEERLARAERIGKAEYFVDLGAWALLKGLEEQSRASYRRAIAIDPDVEAARRALGHARLDGKWVDADRVAALEGEGYIVQGLDLVRLPKGEKPPVGATPPVTSGTPGKATPKPVPRALTPEQEKEQAKQEALRAKLLEKRRKQRENFEEQKRREYDGVPWGNAHEIKARFYDIKCNSTREVAETYGTIMDLLYLELSRRFKQKHLRMGRLPINIYKTQEEFMQRTGMGPYTGGFYRPGQEQVHAFHGVFGQTATTFSVLAHEGTHQFQGRVLQSMGNLNNWMIEGFAVYFGDGTKLDYKRKKIITGLIPRDRLLHVQDKMRAGTHEPLNKLAGLPRNRFGGSQYADSWAILYFLINGPDKVKGQEMVSKYWSLGCEQKVGQEEFNVLADHYFGGVEPLEEKYKEFILGLTPEPAGELEEDGAVFVSLDFMFEILRPDSSWKILIDDLRPQELVALVQEGNKDRISVNILPKPDDQQSPQEFIDTFVVPSLEKKYAKVTHRQAKLEENDAYFFEWVDPDPEEEKVAEGEKGGTAGTDPKPGTPPDPKPAGPKPGVEGDEPQEPVERKKYRAYVIVGITNAYVIRGEYPLDTFEARVDSFELVASSFRRIFRNRW